MIRSLNIWWAAWIWLAAALIVLGSPQGAHAQTKRVAVLDFTGPSGSAYQAQVTAGLKQRDDVELVSAREVKSTAQRLGNSLDSESDYQEVGEALELSAFVEGTVAKKSGRKVQATVTVRNAATGEVIHEETWSRKPRDIKRVRPTVWSALGPAIRESSPPAPKAKPKPATKTKPKPTPPPVADAEDEEDEEDEQDERRSRRDEDEEDEEPPAKKSRKSSVPGDKSVNHPALVAAFGPRIMWRSLDYEGSPTSTNFQTYSSTDEGAPSFNLALAAQWYPGAHTSNAWYSDLGLDFDLDYAVGLKAKVAETNRKVNVSAWELGIGAIYRIPLDAFEPRIRVGFVKQVFDVDLDSMPGLSYSNVRFGVGTPIVLTDWLSFDVNFAYLAVLGVGELSKPEYGEDVSAKAWEAGAGALFRFKETWGARIALDYRRYKYDFGLSDNEMTTLPKSGTDGYLRLSLQVMYFMPGEKK